MPREVSGYRGIGCLGGAGAWIGEPRTLGFSDPHEPVTGAATFLGLLGPAGYGNKGATRVSWKTHPSVPCLLAGLQLAAWAWQWFPNWSQSH